jgi:hypothetical protein
MLAMVLFCQITLLRTADAYNLFSDILITILQWALKIPFTEIKGNFVDCLKQQQCKETKISSLRAKKNKNSTKREKPAA